MRCIELGAEDYLHKPVNPVLLRARIGASLEKKRLRDQQKELVRRFATPEVAQDLDASGFALGGHRVQATAMFSDIRGFTSMAEELSPEETIELLNTYYTLMFDAISGQGGVVNQMVGDGLMAIFGAPLPLADPCGAAARAALDMIEMIALFNREPDRAGKPVIAIGIGIASGDVIAGYTGTQNRATYTCVGDTVNLAARLEAHTKTAGFPILIDEATRSALGERCRGSGPRCVVDQGQGRSGYRVLIARRADGSRLEPRIHSRSDLPTRYASREWPAHGSCICATLFAVVTLEDNNGYISKVSLEARFSKSASCRCPG